MNLQSQGKRVVRAMSWLWSNSLRTPLLRLLAVLGFAVAAWLLSGTASAYADSPTPSADGGSNVSTPADSVAAQASTTLSSTVERLSVASPLSADSNTGGPSDEISVSQPKADSAEKSSGGVVSAVQTLLGSHDAASGSSLLDPALRPAHDAAASLTDDAGASSNSASLGDASVTSSAPTPVETASPAGQSRAALHAVDVVSQGSHPAAPMLTTWSAEVRHVPAVLVEPIAPQPSGGAGQVGGGSGANSGSAFGSAGAVLPEGVMPEANDGDVVGRFEDTALVSEFSADRSVFPD